MEKWRKNYLKRINYKGWSGVDFYSQMNDVIYKDDDVDDFTVPLKTVLEEIIWKWEVLNETENDQYYFYSNYQKRQFKSVSNTFLKKYGNIDLISNFYKRKIKQLEKGGLKLK